MKRNPALDYPAEKGRSAYGSVDKLESRFPHKEEIVGSSPTTATMIMKFCGCCGMQL